MSNDRKEKETTMSDPIRNMSAALRRVILATKADPPDRIIGPFKAKALDPDAKGRPVELLPMLQHALFLLDKLDRLDARRSPAALETAVNQIAAVQNILLGLGLVSINDLARLTRS